MINYALTDGGVLGLGIDFHSPLGVEDRIGGEVPDLANVIGLIEVERRADLLLLEQAVLRAGGHRAVNLIECIYVYLNSTLATINFLTCILLQQV